MNRMGFYKINKKNITLVKSGPGNCSVLGQKKKILKCKSEVLEFTGTEPQDNTLTFS